MGYYVKGSPLLGEKSHPFIGRDVEGADLSITFPRERHVRQFLNEFLSPDKTDEIFRKVREFGAGDLNVGDRPFYADVYLANPSGYRALVKANTRVAKDQLREVAREKYGIDMENPKIVPPEEIFGKVA